MVASSFRFGMRRAIGNAPGNTPAFRSAFRLASGSAFGSASRSIIAPLRRLPLAAVTLVLTGVISVAHAAPDAPLAMKPAVSTETIVLIRHGEKPPAGLGQLTCQGLRRSLALPGVLRAMYGVADVIMAPDPAKTKLDGGRAYAYVRPLATIEPTAVAMGLPVETTLGFDDREGLVDRLLEPGLRNKTVFVAWEHRIAEQVAKALLQRAGGDAGNVPRWSGSDYDSLYVVRLQVQRDGTASATFVHDYEHLDGQDTTCPG